MEAGSCHLKEAGGAAKLMYPPMTCNGSPFRRSVEVGGLESLNPSLSPLMALVLTSPNLDDGTVEMMRTGAILARWPLRQRDQRAESHSSVRE